MKVTAIFAQAILLKRRVVRRIKMAILRPLFRSHGNGFWFDPDGFYTFHTISVGNDVFLGEGTHIQAAETTVDIGNKVMFGPNVSIVAGNHNTSLVGRFMKDVKTKRPQDDLPVRIEDDVWIGYRAIIGNGVTVGRGSIVAMGAVVTKDVPPYCIAAGVPARVLKTRFDLETILQHENELYPPEERLGRERLVELLEDHLAQ